MVKVNEQYDNDYVEYLDITSMDGDRLKYAYDLMVTKQTRDSIYAESSLYDWSYRVVKNTGEVFMYRNRKVTKIADTSTWTLYQ